MLDAPCFQLGARYRIEKTNALAHANRARERRKEAQAMAATYLDDAGIAARNIDDWCEWFKLYQRYLSREDTQVFCRHFAAR